MAVGDIARVAVPEAADAPVPLAIRIVLANDTHLLDLGSSPTAHAASEAVLPLVVSTEAVHRARELRIVRAATGPDSCSGSDPGDLIDGNVAYVQTRTGRRTFAPGDRPGYARWNLGRDGKSAKETATVGHGKKTLILGPVPFRIQYGPGQPHALDTQSERSPCTRLARLIQGPAFRQ